MAHASTESPSQMKRHAKGFLVAVSALLAVLSKRAKLKIGAGKPPSDEWKIELRSPKKTWSSSSSSSPLARPKKLLSHLSSKTLPFGHGKKKEYKAEAESEAWGDGGVWQKSILMGDKCQPLDFSGVIYYDSNGKQLNEIPLRSPRASPLPGYLARPRQHNI